MYNRSFAGINSIHQGKCEELVSQIQIISFLSAWKIHSRKSLEIDRNNFFSISYIFSLLFELFVFRS